MPLSDSHWRTLSAAVDRIVPADEWPSASEAGVLDFLLKLLPEQSLESRYAAGAEGIEAEAQAEHATAFEDLTAEAQDAVLQRIELGEVKTKWNEPPEQFFGFLSTQVIEGYYADPGNGGNRDGVAWKMVGFRVTA